jgi:signal transduction histidine kinase
MKRFRFGYRFNFFQRQFLSHMLITLLILVLLGAGLFYYMKMTIYKNKSEELVSASKAITKVLQKEDEPLPSLMAYRTFLSERNISFILINRNGDLLYKESILAPTALRSRPFIESLRNKIGNFKNDQSFLIEQTTADPLMVSPRTFRSKAKDEMFLYVMSPVRGVSAILYEINRSILYTFGAAFFFAILISWIISRNLTRSVKMIRRATRQIAEGDLSARSPVNRSDELGDLSKDFNAMAQQLEEASSQVALLEKRRGHFIVDITHELRTPLTSIRGIIEGFKNQLITKPEEQQKYYSIIEKETFRLIRLINEMLDMEKVQSGQITLRSQSINVNELLEVVAESLEVLIEEKNLQIQIQCEPDIEVFGDYDRLTQVLLNLVKNSIQFTEYGTIRLSAHLDDKHTILEVADTGKGMSKEELEFIWDRFYKADPSRSKERGESGLGLSIVKRLVEAHQGSIHVKSEQGIGTTFRLTLPREDLSLSNPEAESIHLLAEPSKPIPNAKSSNGSH